MRRSGIFLFLMELVVMLAVFALAAAVCIRILVLSQDLSRDSRDLSSAVEYATSAAECWKAHGDGDAIGMERKADRTWVLTLDDTWKPVDQGAPGGCYRVILTPQDGQASIAVEGRDQEVLYTLQVEEAAYDR